MAGRIRYRIFSITILPLNNRHKYLKQSLYNYQLTLLDYTFPQTYNIYSMKTIAILSTALFAVSSSEAFISPTNTKVPSSLCAEIGDTGVAFENVAREWRCKVSLDSVQLYLCT